MANPERIDTIFVKAVESKAMPGIAAGAATDTGHRYESAFGKREIAKDAPMTLPGMRRTVTKTTRLAKKSVGISASSRRAM